MTPPPATVLTALDLTLDGVHPAAWRRAQHTPAELLTGARVRSGVLAAESAGHHLVTFSDPGPRDAAEDAARNRQEVAGRLATVHQAAHTALLTRSVALVPEVDVVHGEPFHLAVQAQSLDGISRGRAGFLVRADSSPERAAAVGRDPLPPGRLGREAADVVEAARRLWDSWEDGAVVRDVPTGRYVDRGRLHYADFRGESFSLKGTSIAPRPPQGTLPVLAPEGLLPAGTADVVVIRAGSVEDLVRVARRVRAAEDEARAGRARGGAPGEGVRVLADLDVLLDARGQAAADRLAELDASTPWASPTARVLGPAEDLVEAVAALAGAVDVVRLRPAVLDLDAPEIAQLVLPRLRAPGLLADRRPDTTLRAQLGLPRPVNRYTDTHQEA